jgi:DNA-binding transcriptional ArsR family regulator
MRAEPWGRGIRYDAAMNDGPHIVRIASLVADRARAEMLTALMGGQALTATELAEVAEVTKATASGHLARLLDASIVAVESQGRHRYFRLAHEDIAHLLESLLGVAWRTGAVRLKSSPRDPDLRRARVCYDHLAGELGVLAFEAFEKRRWLEHGENGLGLSRAGERKCRELGLVWGEGRRPVCRACLDWSARRHHLAGQVGAALLQRCYALGWAKRRKGTRVVDFTAGGERAFLEAFGHAS